MVEHGSSAEHARAPYANVRECPRSSVASSISSHDSPQAMVGILTAIPCTPLRCRLGDEGRLRGAASGDAFGPTNFVPRDGRTNAAPRVPQVSSRRSAPPTRTTRAAPSSWTSCRGSTAPRPGLELNSRTFVHSPPSPGIGVRIPRQRQYWSLLLRALRRGADAPPRVLALAGIGESLVDYTRTVVLPRIDRSLAEVGPAHVGRARPARAVRRPPRYRIGPRSAPFCMVRRSRPRRRPSSLCPSIPRRRKRLGLKATVQSCVVNDAHLDLRDASTPSLDRSDSP